MFVRVLVVGILLCLAQSAAQSQGTAAGAVAWYNGDRRSGIPGFSNWYVSPTELSRVYDNFEVPDGGWIATSVYSNNTFYEAPTVSQAAWEIRSYMAAESAGTLIASGVDAASVTYDSALRTYRVEVNGLNVTLPPGHYWLNVAPVGPAQGQSYIAATLGANAVGIPPGNDGGALYCSSANGMSFSPISSTGSAGTSADFSQGVSIAGSAGISGSAPPLLSRSEQWRANVLSLVEQMPLLHSLPFSGIGLAEFKANAATLYDRIPALSEPQIRTALDQLVASIGDSHTDVSWPYPRPFRQLPLTFYWFDDGIYVTAASTQYQNLLGGKLLSVGQTGIDDAVRILSSLVPHENDQRLKHRIPLQELTNADFLFGKGLISSVDAAPLEFALPSGSIISAEVQTYAGSTPQQTPVVQGSLPLYQMNAARNYWATIIDGGSTLYFQYNSCKEDPKQPSSAFFQELDRMMAQESVQRIVLDMRNNGGGYTSILSPWIEEIKASRFNQPGRLYVIVGRATFSAAMEATNHFHDRTSAIFVGEPTGAKPQFELRRGDFALPYFGIRVSYSQGVESATVPDSTLVPDIKTGLTFEQYVQGVDPALNAILSIPAPHPSRACAVSLSPREFSAPETASNLVVTVQAGDSCAWTVSGLPNWISISGEGSGTGTGTVALAIAANPAAQRGALVSIGGASLPVTQKGPGSCDYSLSSGGQSFPPEGGSGSVNVITSAGCSWVVVNPLSWLAVSGNGSGSGPGALSFTVSKNPGATQWGALYIAGVPFTVQRGGAAEAGLTLIGSVAQFASGGGWETSFTLVNLGGEEREAQLQFLDNNGHPPVLPLTVPQLAGIAALPRAVYDQTLESGGMVVLNTTGPETQPSATGSAQLLTNGDIDGFAVFTNTPTGQAAVAPIETRDAARYVLPFDNTGGVGAGLAIANLAAMPADVKVTLRDDAGAQIGAGLINLPARGHNSFMLTDSAYGFPGTAGIRGIVEFETPSDGRISVLGLRANPIPDSSGFAVTSLPTLADVAPGGGLIPHIAWGAGWETRIELVNSSADQAVINLSFFAKDGSPARLSLLFPQTGETVTASTVTKTIPSKGSVLVVIQNSGATETAGSAVLSTAGTVGGFAIFRYGPTGQEAAVPLQPARAGSYILAFDNTGGASTGLAIANAAAQAGSANVIIRNDSGAQIGAGSIDLPAQGHSSFMLSDEAAGGWAITAGIRGTIQFEVPNGGWIAPLGLRAVSIPGGFTITTIPLIKR